MYSFVHTHTLPLERNQSLCYENSQTVVLTSRDPAGADVRLVNMRELTSGVLHTKFWVVDKKHVYIGSANMDWRSLTQVGSPGVYVAFTNTPLLQIIMS